MTGLKRILPLIICALFSISLSPLVSHVTAKDLTLTIVYDNNTYDKNLETRWGFSCYVKGAEKTLLFDVGGEGSVLLNNMEKLKIDPSSVNAVVLSHIHYDHIGGLSRFLKRNPDVTVYLPRSFPPSVKDAVRKAGACLAEIHDPTRICKEVYSTGELGTFIKEESLIIKTSKGLIVITGCAHPGIVKIIERAKEILKTDVHLVLGGFHLCGMNLSQLRKTINGVKKTGCRKVAPCHCSGDLARKEFKKAYGKDFICVGAGKTVTIKDAF
jgi:7,8-dihydropterin-6-yl-methyl-4-(beta-D-ribofuranosyl)aminobenzene 5'-phosphate synthase